MKDWQKWHANKGSWDDNCVPSRNEEGSPYCATHGGDANGFMGRRFASFPDELDLKGFDLPPKDYGWKCPFAQERLEIYVLGYSEGYAGGQQAGREQLLKEQESERIEAEKAARRKR